MKSRTRRSRREREREKESKRAVTLLLKPRNNYLIHARSPEGEGGASRRVPRTTSQANRAVTITL